jgi:hypothetical protein
MSFAFVGFVGPILIPVLRSLSVGSVFYYPLHTFISVLCPAWLLGVLEYRHSAILTWLVILAANVAIWAMLGLLVALADLLRLAIIVFGAVLVAVAYTSYWMSASPTAVLIMVAIVVAAYAMAVRGPNGAVA